MSGIEPISSEPLESTPSRIRTPRRAVFLVATVLLAVWVAASAFLVLDANRAAGEGIDELRELERLAEDDLARFVPSSKSGSGDEDGGSEVLIESLERAGSSFQRANSRADSLVLRPLRLVPVLGRQLGATITLSESAATVSTATASALSDIQVAAEQAPSDPGERLEASESVATTLRRLSSELAELDTGPTEGLLTPLADARAEFVEQLDKLRESVAEASTAIEGVNSFMRGPSRYLVLAANNSEMRAGSGMFLQVGVLTVVDGFMELGTFRPAEELLLDAPGATIDPDVERLWGALEPAQEWRNLNLTPRFDESARMASEMWSAFDEEPVDGVIALDVIALRNLLAVVGPVDIDDERGRFTVDEGSVENELLLQQYLVFADDRDQRRDRLGNVVSSAFGAFNEREIRPVELVRFIQNSGQGRHLLMWSSNPTHQDAWEVIGASGVIPPNALLVALINRGGNKLDQFVDVAVALAVDDTPTGDRRIRLRVHLSNRSPEQLPQYVGGPFPGIDVRSGDYLGILGVTIPAGAGNVVVEGGPTTLLGDDGPARLVGSNVLLPRGESLTVTIGFDLPPEWQSMEVIPSTRVPAVNWTAAADSWLDVTPRSIEFDGTK